MVERHSNTPMTPKSISTQKTQTPPSTKGPGRPKDKEKSAAILQAAAALFMQLGMSRVTMDDIAKKAGVSKLTVYNHFGTKETLFQTMIRNKCESSMNDAMFDQLTGDRPREELAAIGRGFIDIIYSQEALAMHRTVMSEARHNPQIAQLFYESAPQRVCISVSLYT